MSIIDLVNLTEIQGVYAYYNMLLLAKQLDGSS